MDALEIAKKIASEATSIFAAGGAETEESIRLGALYAAIAQAEQLKRIANVLEVAYGYAPIYNEAEDYRRNAIPGESLEEYRERLKSEESPY